MNKKFFAALASATMALSATGSLAVFADDFDATEETGNWVDGSVTTKPDGSVDLTEANFPNKDFRNAIADKFGLSDGDNITKANLESVTSILINDNGVFINPTNWTTPGAPNSAKVPTNVEGVEYFPNLKTFQYSASAAIKSIDLSANKKLNSVAVLNATALTSLDLPETNTLSTVVVKGTSSKKTPLPLLDLSGNKGLTKVEITDTQVAVLDFSNNPYLTDVIVTDNEINTLNLDGSLKINNVNAAGNHLYTISLPDYSGLTTLNVSGNKLVALDVTKQLNLENLYAQDNCLDKIDLSENSELTNLWIFDNNLGYLDVTGTKVTNIVSQTTPADPSIDSKVSPQHAFVNEEYDSVDLVKNFEGLDKDNLKSDLSTNVKQSDIDKGIFTFDKDAVAGSYVYNVGKALMRVDIIKANLMNRLYNPNSGEHFYTKDLNEKDVLVSLGWQDEGIGWVAPTEEKGSKPVYRLYNPNAGDHHYTMNSRERDALVSAGWKAEGIGWYSANEGVTTWSSTETGENVVNSYGLGLFREYNPNAKAAGSHNYTLNEAENDFLCSVGWVPEGIAWFALK